MAIEQFKPGWLEESLHEAVLSIRVNHDKARADLDMRHAGGQPDVFPLGWDEAEELAARMSQRFKTWTGRTLDQHFAARPR